MEIEFGSLLNRGINHRFKDYNSYGFEFIRGEKETYIVVELSGPDLFADLYKGDEETPDKWVSHDTIIQTLEGILKMGDNKDNTAFTGWMGYGKYIDLENEIDARVFSTLSRLDGRKDTDLHFDKKPYKSLDALKRQYANRVLSRKSIRSGQTMNTSEINVQRIEISVIVDYENEVNNRLAISNENRLIDNERDNANEFLSWLSAKKQEIYKPNIEQEATTDQPKPDFEKLLSEIKSSENQFVISMPMEKVINHFRVFTEKQSKNRNPFLTQEQLVLFLQKAFLNKPNIEKQKINLANGQKGYVIKRFYEFFALAVADYSELNKKDKYIKLLSDNFTNWKSAAIKDMFKPNKTKANW